MKHRNTKALRPWSALLMVLAVLGTAKGQTGIFPDDLEQQWLAAYSTDFPDHTSLPVVYRSPYPNDDGIWKETDMHYINFYDVLGFGKVELPAIKAMFKEEDVPVGERDEPAITIRMGLYDDSNEEHVIIAPLLKFYTTYNATTQAGDEYVGLGSLVGEGLYGQYHTQNIKQVIFKSEMRSSLIGSLVSKDNDQYDQGSKKIIVEIEFLYPAKITSLYLPGIGEIAPQALMYAKDKNTFDLPTTETIVDLPYSDYSKIYRWTWSGENRLYGSKDNILNIAELDFSRDTNLELKIDYVFKDPRVDPNNFNPKTLRTKNGSGPGLKNIEQLANSKSMDEVAPIMLDQPQSGMFDVVSNRAARAGALFAVNGAFYDYYYYCLPGVKTSLKIDGTWHYKPDIFNHRNTGALVFSNTDFDFIRNKRHDDYIIDEHGDTYTEAKNAYKERGAGWANLMSGGHFSEKGKPYRFHKPGALKEIERNTASEEWGKPSFFWQNPKSYYTMGDESVPGNEDKGTIADRYKGWNKEEFGIWARIACQRRDDRNKKPGDYQQMRKDKSGQWFPDVNKYSFSELFMPELLTSPKQVTIGNGSIAMTPKDAANLYTAVDYERYPHEFGQQKRGRTFIAKKGEQFYILTADGIYTKEYGEETKVQYYAKTAPGLTINELSDLSQKLKFDALLNLDGGGSSTFFVNGRGMVQSPYAGFAEGPMQQRYLSTTLMVVPKIQSKNIKPEKDKNEHHLRFDNFHLDSNRYVLSCPEDDVLFKESDCSIIPYNKWPQVQALSLTPSLDHFIQVDDANEGGIIAGSFKIESSEPGNSSKGAILFAMSENGQYEKLKDPKTGKDYDQSTIPDSNDPAKKIKTVLSDTRSLFVVGVGQMPDELLETLRSLRKSLSEEERSKWDSFLDENDQASYVVLVNNKEVEFFQVDNTGEAGRWANYLNGEWHNFNVYYNHDASVREFKMVFDGQPVTVPYHHTKAVSDMDSHFFGPNHITNAMIGAIPMKGGYITPERSDLSVDNYMFVIGKGATKSFLETLKTVQNTTSPDTEAIQKMSQDMADNNHQLPSEYTGFSWNDPNKNQWYLQFEEGTGYHAHAVNNEQKPHFYGLNLWGEWITNKILDGGAGKKTEDVAEDSVGPKIAEGNQDEDLAIAGPDSETLDVPENSAGNQQTAATNSLVDDTLRHSWNVYPNPASSSLFLDLVLEESTPLDIYLFNLSGQQLFHARSARMERGKNRVDLGEIARRFGGRQQLYTLKVRGNGFAPIDTKVMIK